MEQLEHKGRKEDKKLVIMFFFINSAKTIASALIATKEKGCWVKAAVHFILIKPANARAHISLRGIIEH